MRVFEGTGSDSIAIYWHDFVRRDGHLLRQLPPATAHLKAGIQRRAERSGLRNFNSCRYWSWPPRGCRLGNDHAAARVRCGPPTTPRATCRTGVAGVSVTQFRRPQRGAIFGRLCGKKPVQTRAKHGTGRGPAYDDGEARKRANRGQKWRQLATKSATGERRLSRFRTSWRDTL